jgi:hypothetical protein
MIQLKGPVPISSATHKTEDFCKTTSLHWHATIRSHMLTCALFFPSLFFFQWLLFTLLHLGHKNSMPMSSHQTKPQSAGFWLSDTPFVATVQLFLSPPIIHMDKTWQDYATMRSSFYQLTDWPHLEPPSDHSGLRIISTCAAHLLALVVERTMPGGPSLNVLSLTNSWRKRGLQVVAKQSWKHQFRSK